MNWLQYQNKHVLFAVLIFSDGFGSYLEFDGSHFLLNVEWYEIEFFIWISHENQYKFRCQNEFFSPETEKNLISSQPGVCMEAISYQI